MRTSLDRLGSFPRRLTPVPWRRGILLRPQRSAARQVIMQGQKYRPRLFQYGQIRPGRTRSKRRRSVQWNLKPRSRTR